MSKQNPEEIPLLSADERAEAAGTSVDMGPSATGTRQRTFKEAVVAGPDSGPGSGAGSNEGTGERAADKGQALRAKGGAFAAQAERDVKGVVGLAQQGVASGTWLYPVRGVVYLLTRESNRLEP